MDANKIKESIFASIDQINLQMPQSEMIAKDINEKIAARLDSFGLINFVVIVEEQIKKDLNKDIALSGEEVMNQKQNPFQTIQTLIDYIQSQIGDGVN